MADALGITMTFRSVLGQKATATFESVGGPHDGNSRPMELTEDERLALEDLLTSMIDRRDSARHG